MRRRARRARLHAIVRGRARRALRTLAVVVDPSRKRRIRSSWPSPPPSCWPARSPTRASRLERGGGTVEAAGQRRQRPLLPADGKVVDGSIRNRATRRCSAFATATGRTSVPVRYVGTVPDPFRDGREVIVTVRKQGAIFVGRARLARDEVPVEVHRQAQAPSVTWRRSAAPACSSPSPSALRHRRVALRRRGPGADWVDSGRRAVYGLALLTTAAFAILEVAFLRSDFSFTVVATHSSTTTPTFYRSRPRGPRRRARCCCGCGCCRCGRASCCSRAPPAARRRALRDRRAARLRRVLRRAARLRRLAVRTLATAPAEASG
jgi:hypothetical protein